MSRNVLLVIDLQNGFVHDQSKHVIPVIERLMVQRPWDVIIQTRWMHKEKTSFTERLFYRDMAAKGKEDLVLNHGNFTVIKRHTYNALNKDLVKCLKKQDEIYVCGLEIDACVLATCYALFDEGYNFRVVQDAVSSKRTSLYKPCLELMERNFGSDTLVQSQYVV